MKIAPFRYFYDKKIHNSNVSSECKRFTIEKYCANYLQLSKLLITFALSFLSNPSLPMKKITIIDIAHHLCLSPSTVSRALADDKSIRQETKDLVNKAADELGYRRNRLAVSLRSGKTNTIGMIVNEMVTPSTLHVIAGAEKALHAKRMHMMIANSEESHEREKANLRMMEGAQVDGLIVLSCSDEENTDEFLGIKRAGIPIIFIKTQPPSRVIASSIFLNGRRDDIAHFALGERAVAMLLDIISNPSVATQRVILDKI